MSLKVLLDLKASLKKEEEEIRASIEPALAVVRDQMANADAAIHDLLARDLASIRKLQAKEYGAVNMTKDGFRVTETIPKKVKWDQGLLHDVFNRIQNSGDDPFQWMKAEFKVGEKEFATYPKEIQSVFLPARTVMPGEPKIEFKPLDQKEAPDA